MTEHDELPLPDYDHLDLGSLTSRVRSLDADGVETLLGYERAHGNRTPVVVVLENRLSSLQAGAQPSGGDPAGRGPRGGARRGRRVEGLRGDLRAAGEPAVPGRPDQPGPAPLNRPAALPGGPGAGAPRRVAPRACGR